MATINQVLVNDVLYDIEVNAENVVGEVNKATVATKVGIADKGSATQPIYLKAGVPTATTYKLEANVPSNAKFTDTTYTLGSFGITASAAELNYCDGVTSNIQTQLNGKQASITGAATSITGSNLTSDRAVVSDASGKVRSSDITVSELNCLDNVSGNIQTQLNRKPNVSMTLSGTTLYITST